jgi:valyl-tRNA synthetase
MEILCSPPTAATRTLHLGNLYNWILVDAYKKGGRLRKEKVIARESWNCHSQKLEEAISAEHPDYSTEEIAAECKKHVEENISNAKGIFQKYNLEFDQPTIRDDSKEYQYFIKQRLRKAKDTGEINSEYFLELLPKEKVLEVCKDIRWVPKEIWKRFKGLSEEVMSIPLLRKGFYGISIDDLVGQVVGQRFVQFELPQYYNDVLGEKLNLGIFGNDILIKWVYFMIASNKEKPFERLGLSGLVLSKDKEKLSKYQPGVKLIDEIECHPDNVRLSLLKQSFGRDFVYPEFRSEEKLRRKFENCVIFLRNFANINECSDFKEIESDIDLLSARIGENIYRLDFLAAYKEFYSLVYEEISKRSIEQIKLKGINKKTLDRLIAKIEEIAEIFAPKTMREIKRQSL